MANTLEDLKQAAHKLVRREFEYKLVYEGDKRGDVQEFLVAQTRAEDALRAAARAYVGAVKDEPCGLCGKPGCNTGCT